MRFQVDISAIDQQLLHNLQVSNCTCQMQRGSMQDALEIDVCLFAHQDQVDQVVPLSTDRHVQSAHLIIQAQDVRVNIGVKKQIRSNLGALVLNCKMQEGLVAQSLG